MTNKEILTKAIEKAVKNGFFSSTEKVEVEEDVYGVIKHVYLYSPGFIPNPFIFHPLEIIFSFMFAKAFFGELGTSDIPQSYLAWKHHLQQMVLEEDPIKYLEKFV